MDTVQAIKQRFEIIGNEPKLNRDKKPFRLRLLTSVLVVGESGVGKESIPKLYIPFLTETWEVYHCKLWCNTGRND
jgi:hypothetical protein